MATAANVALAALKAELDGGRLFFFAGPVPATAEEALDMATDHTQLVEMTEGGDGATGLTFDAPVDGAMVKAAAEEWTGLIAFDGAEDGETTLEATFWRFCPAGDNGRGVTTDVRLQGTIGGPGASIPMVNANLTANGSNTQGASYFAVTESPAA